MTFNNDVEAYITLLGLLILSFWGGMFYGEIVTGQQIQYETTVWLIGIVASTIGLILINYNVDT